MIFKYLWYKLYRASLKSSLKEVPILFSGALFGLLLNLNIITLSALLSKLNIMPFIYQRTYYGTIINIITIILSWAYFSGSRAQSIIYKFSKETNKQRIKGNIYVAIYIFISVLSIFGIIFYKPGYLP